MGRSRSTRSIALVLFAVAVVLLLGALGALLRRRAVPPDGRAAAAPTSSAGFFVHARDPGAPAGTLTGTVRDTTGKPVVGAALVVTRAGAPERDRGDVSLDASAQATSESGGAFRFERLVPGTYVVTATAPGYVAGSRADVRVAAGATTDVEVRLGDKGATLTGTLVDSGGGPVAGLALLSNLDDGRIFRAAAGTDGRFTVALPLGWYQVTARADGYAPTTKWVPLFGDQSVEVRLHAASRVDGRVVTDTDGEPVADAEVLLSPVGGGVRGARHGISDADGRFWFGDVAPGLYELRARRGPLVGIRPGWVSVGAGALVSAVEIRLSGGRSVAGRVTTPDGKPVAGARIAARSLASGAFRGEVAADSGADGTFRITGLVPGRHQLDARAGDRARGRTEVAVGRLDLTGVSIVLDASGVLEGRVVDAAGAPAVDATVTAFVRTSSGSSDQNAQTKTNADGTYRVAELAAGKLEVVVQHATGTTTAGPVEIGPGETKHLDLQLEAGASVSGTVYHLDGTPAARAHVTAHHIYGYLPALGVTSDPAGRFALPHVPPGDLVVIARFPQDRSWLRQIPKPNHARFPLRAGEQRTGVDLFVPRPEDDKTISGVVVDAEGRPAAGAIVSAGQEWRGIATRGDDEGVFTGADGAFTIPVQDGKYTVFAVRQDFAQAKVTGVDPGATGVRVRFQAPSGVEGRAVDEAGAPVGHYSLRITPSETRDLDKRDMWLEGHGSHEVQVADPAGRFTLQPLESGRYDVSVLTPDDQQGKLGNVEIREGQTTRGLTIVVRRSARLEGRVVEYGTGRPIPGALIRGLAAALDLQTTADSAGKFVLTGVPTGRVQSLRISTERSTHVQETWEVTIPEDGGRIELPDVKMHPGRLDWMTPDAGLTGLGPVTRDGRASVGGVRPGSPAFLAGVKPGDLVLAVDGKSVEDAGSSTVGFLMRGRAGDPVTVRLQTPGEAVRDVTFVRSPR